MSKTIKQIADELGVSKQAVVKRIDNLGLRSKLVKNGNLYLVDDTAEKLIKSGTLKQIQSTPSSSMLVETLQAQVDILKQQLDIKDEQIKGQLKQIEQLTAALESTTAALTAAQALHAADKKQLLIEDSQNPPKRHWWNRRKG